MLKEINLSRMAFYSILAYKKWVLICLYEKGLYWKGLFQPFTQTDGVTSWTWI